MDEDKKDSRVIDPKGYYTVAEAAELLCVHRSTIWRWVKKLRLKRRTRQVNSRNEFLGADLLKIHRHN